MFKANLLQTELLKKAYKEQPRQFAKASQYMLNAQVWEMKKKYIPETINKTMTVRSKGFVNSSIQFDKARPRTDINKQIATVGSIFRGGFTGWQEQEGVKNSKTITRGYSLLSRKGSKQRKVTAAIRLKPSTKVYKEGDFKIITTKKGRKVRLKTKSQRTTAMIKEATKKKGKYRSSLFFIEPKGISGRLTRLKRGYYGLAKGRLVRMHMLGKGIDTKCNNWMSKSRAALPDSFVQQKFIVLAREHLGLKL